MYNFREHRSDHQVPRLIREIIENGSVTITLGREKDRRYFAYLCGDDGDQEFTATSLVSVLRDSLDWIQAGCPATENEEEGE